MKWQWKQEPGESGGLWNKDQANAVALSEDISPGGSRGGQGAAEVSRALGLIKTLSICAPSPQATWLTGSSVL